MKKILCVALTMIFAVGLLTGCVFFQENTDVVATVNGEKIMWEDFYYIYDSYAYQYEYYYGMSRTDATYSAYFDQLKTDILDSLIDSEILRQQCVSLGILPLDEEGMAEARAALDKDIRAYKDSVIEEEKEADGEDLKSDEEYEAIAEETMNSFYANNNTSYDRLLEDYCTDVAVTKLKAYYLDGITVTDTEIRDYYDQALAEQKADFDADCDEYEDAVLYGETIYYNLEGYRWVSHVLIEIDDESSTAISTARSEAATAKSNAESATDETEKAEQMLAYETKTKEADDLLAAALAKLDDKVKAFYDKVAADGWEAAREEYNTDTSSGTGTDGYLIGPNTEGYVEGFVTAARALENVGDYNSKPASSDYGYHIVRMDIKVTGGEVSLEDVKDAISTELLSSKQSSEWTEKFNGWYNAAKIEKFEAAIAREA